MHRTIDVRLLLNESIKKAALYLMPDRRDSLITTDKENYTSHRY